MSVQFLPVNPDSQKTSLLEVEQLGDANVSSVQLNSSGLTPTKTNAMSVYSKNKEYFWISSSQPDEANVTSA